MKGVIVNVCPVNDVNIVHRQIQEDSAYPSWLWSLNTGPAPRLDELDPSSKRYWLRVRAAGMRRNNKLRSMRRF